MAREREEVVFGAIDEMNLGEWIVEGQLVLENVIANAQIEWVWSQPRGISREVSADLVVPANALLSTLDVIVQAQQAVGVPLLEVGQMRSQSVDGEDALNVVVDFGTPRTVAAVEMDPALGLVIDEASAWSGMNFLYPFFRNGDAASVTFPSEVRTERLLLKLGRDGALDFPRASTLAERTVLWMPEVPSDLELVLDDGPPVWSEAGPVQPGTEEEPSRDAWSSTSRRRIALADALADRTGDPAATGDVTVKVTLRSSVPGRLALELPEPGTELRQLALVRRIDFDGSNEEVLRFDEEGVRELVLPLPPARRRGLVALALEAVGAMGEDRVLPTTGPPASQDALLELDRDRAACVRLRPRTGIAQLDGLRLPLLPEPGGAEVHVVLLTGGADGPGEPLPDGTSQPVTLEPPPDPGPDETQRWTRFQFQKPVPLDDDAMPWAAVVCVRGGVRWHLAEVFGTEDPVLAQALRVGTPSGPWKGLPGPVAAGGALGHLRGRVRLAGASSSAAPIAPVVIRVAGTQERLELVPTSKGARAELVPSAPIALNDPSELRLEIESRTAGELRLRDVEVTTTT